MDAKPPLPEDPQLRSIAEALDAAGVAVEIFDPKWRLVFTSTENARVVGLDPATVGSYYGLSPPARVQLYPGEWGTDRDSGRAWWRECGPHMVRDVPPNDPDFDAVFGTLAPRARELEPAPPSPALRVAMRFPGLERMHKQWHGALQLVHVRLHDAAGRFLGSLVISTPDLPQSLAMRLARGDLEMFRRMDRLREAQPRATAILFADLEASSELARRLPPQAYFELIRDLTDLIDAAVAAHRGILGKHAGDGASALFLAEDAGSDSEAARNAIQAARTIRDRAQSLIDGVRVKIGIHWGSALTVGQVSTRGRLEVTALGDEMNEAARIESAARGGTLLASKRLIERLSTADADAVHLELDTLAYRTIAELTTDEKAIRDAGSTAVAEL